MKNTRLIKAYTINDIALWQTELQENQIKERKDISKISLPSLQRGFVWKPYQIEALWDSILRGYPVGAILMSLSNGQRELLDGQQRCSSIALGFYNPFGTNDFKEFLNLKENIPSIWIDLKPIVQNKYGLKFGVRVLTRSHPWGYQLTDYRQTITMSDRQRALEHFRKGTEKNYTDLKANEINPWEAIFPVPLAFLLDNNTNILEDWKTNLKAKIENHLKEIKTRFSNGNNVNYLDIEEIWLDQLFYSIEKAKKILIPEILVKKEVIEEMENFEDGNYESSDATLFIRLNSEGTRISGEELVYSLLKSNFPELKVLVERIGMKYIAPSRIVNLFARLTLIELSDFENFQPEINISSFRKNLMDINFRDGLKNFIGIETSSEAERLVKEAVSIISSTGNDIPEILSKEMIVKSPDLFLILLTYLLKNKNLSENEKNDIFQGYHYLILFNTDQRKTAQQLFTLLKSNQFKNWNNCINELNQIKPNLLLPLITTNQFETFVTNYIIPAYIKSKGHFSDFDFLKEIISRNIEELDFLFKPFKNKILDEEYTIIEKIHDAVSYWKSISEKIYWNRTFLIFSQRKYFIDQFGTFMEFDGIEDTNRPWDWDHIYPNSWVYSKQGVSLLVRWIVNTNGNFRALSYNENRSQSNHQSPSFRFLDNEKAMDTSFILGNDKHFWLELTNHDTRLLENNPKIESFVNACFIRMVNLYSDWYNVFGNSY